MIVDGDSKKRLSLARSAGANEAGGSLDDVIGDYRVGELVIVGDYFVQPNAPVECLVGAAGEILKEKLSHRCLRNLSFDGVLDFAVVFVVRQLKATQRGK